MEPKGIFPTVTLDIDTWNQESDQIMKKSGVLRASLPEVWKRHLIFLIYLKDSNYSHETEPNKMSNWVFGE